MYACDWYKEIQKDEILLMWFQGFFLFIFNIPLERSNHFDYRKLLNEKANCHITEKHRRKCNSKGLVSLLKLIIIQW